MPDLPTFRPTAISGERCAGTFLPSRLIGEHWVACLIAPGSRLIWGRFQSVDKTALTAVFAADKADELKAITQGEEYPYLDGYYGQRAQLVLSDSHSWKRTEFELQDSVEFESAGGRISTKVSTEQGGGRIVPNGWDHEHCEICHAEIAPSAQPVGFVNENDRWICEVCYRDYVEPKRIGFVPAWATQ